MKFFLKYNVDVNLVNEGEILFIVVCFEKYIYVVEELLKVKVDVN